MTSEKEDEKPDEAPRLRYADEEQAREHNPRRSSHRRGSVSSLSIRSGPGRVVAPEAALPVAYRTLLVGIFSLAYNFILINSRSLKTQVV